MVIFFSPRWLWTFITGAVVVISRWCGGGCLSLGRISLARSLAVLFHFRRVTHLADLFQLIFASSLSVLFHFHRVTRFWLISIELLTFFSLIFIELLILACSFVDRFFLVFALDYVGLSRLRCAAEFEASKLHCAELSGIFGMVF